MNSLGEKDFFSGLSQVLAPHTSQAVLIENMKEEPTKVDASQQEISVLSKALSKSVEMSSRNRYLWIALLAGFLIGAGVAAAIFMLAGSQQHETASDEILLKRSRETLRTVIQIQSQVDRVINDVQTIRKSTESERAEQETPTVSETVENNAPQDPKQSHGTIAKTGNDTIELSRFTVYIHYNGKKQTINKFASFLRARGYTVPAIELVSDRRRDIRYFHEEDREGAGYLRRDLLDFLKGTTGIHDIQMQSMDLSRVYPGASKGSLELWIYF